MVGYFNTLLTSMDKSSRQKINKGTTALNNTLDQMDLNDIFRTIHPKGEEYTYFPSAHDTLPNVVHVRTHNNSQ